MKKTIWVSLVGAHAAILACFFVTSEVRAQSSGVVITQVQITGGAGKTNEDFIELFNFTASPFNLKGYRLVKRSANGTSDVSIKSWTTDTFIPAYSFYLWSNSNYLSIGTTPDTTTAATLADDNGVALREGELDTGTVVDSVAWGAAANGFSNVGGTNPGAGESLLRADLYAAAAVFSLASSSPRNSLFSDQSVSSTTSPTTSTSTPPTAPPPPPPSGSGASQVAMKSDVVKLSEIFPNPLGEDENKEQVELYNFGSQPVNLEGWFLGDKSDTGAKTNSYRLSGLVIQPGTYSVVTIPKGFFALNNSGGDAVNLYFADKILADSVVYDGAAPEGLSLQKIGNEWQWASPTLGGINSVPASPTSVQVNVKINEIFPDPQGLDENKEWVEFWNEGDTEVSLKGFWLDDKSASLTPAASAWELDSYATIAPKSFLVLSIPEDKFSLNNTGVESVKFFNPQKQLIEEVEFEPQGEGKSYSKTAQGWQWGIATPGKENIHELPDYHVVISEIFPSPAASQEEFLELFNNGTSTVAISGLTLTIGTRKTVLEDLGILEPGKYLVLYGEDVGIALRNSGQHVAVVDSYGRKLAAVEYPKYLSAHSYSLNAEGKYEWTSIPTPGEPNVFERMNDVGGIADEESAKVSTKKTTSTSKSTQDTTTQRLIAKIDELQGTVERLAAEIESQKGEAKVLGVSEVNAAEQAEGEKTSVNTGGKINYLFLSGGAFMVLVGAVWVAKSTLLNNEETKKSSQE